MIDESTILSLYDGKATLMQWLKKIEETLKKDGLSHMNISFSNDFMNLVLTFANGEEKEVIVKLPNEFLQDMTFNGSVDVKGLTTATGGLLANDEATFTEGVTISVSDLKVQTGNIKVYDGDLSVVNGKVTTTAGNVEITGGGKLLISGNQVKPLFLHNLQFVVNGDVNLQINIISTRIAPYTSIQTFVNDRQNIVNPSNSGSIFAAQFDLLYIFDLNASPLSIRIFNITNGNYTFSTNIAFVKDTSNVL